MLVLPFPFLALLASLAAATPLRPTPHARGPWPFDARALLCALPALDALLCPRQPSPQTISVPTPLGTARGVRGADGVARFAVRYGEAERFRPSTIATTWDLPNNASDPSALPLVCAQPDVDSASMSEDCLSALLYVPPTATPGADLPVFVWIHGGSFVAGSATGPGLDGSRLAVAAQAIVVVVQYRLGAFGWMAPDGTTNNALRDIIAALAFVQRVAPSLGAAPGRVTVAGQSSGANMVRALLAAPSASDLFTNAVLQSDPMDYGFLSPETQQTLLTAFLASLNCSSPSCPSALTLPTSTLLAASTSLFSAAPSLDASTGAFEPLRPVHDGHLITSPLDATAAPFPRQGKALLLSTVATEAGAEIYGSMGDTPESELGGIVEAAYGAARTRTLLSSSFYTAPASSSAAAGNASNSNSSAGVDARTQLQTLGTDAIWRCPAYTFARLWARAGGRAFVGHFALGATYPPNAGIPFCTEKGSVCHQDDILIVFGTVRNPSAEQGELVREVGGRYGAFMRGGTPNVPGEWEGWEEVSGGEVRARNLGGTGEAGVGACDPGFWGESVPYDYQVYGI